MIDKHLFLLGMKELKNFIPGFKPTEAQVRAWYERLKNVADEPAYRYAIYKLTEERASTITYPALKDAIFQGNHAGKSRAAKLPAIKGGYAPRSAEKHALAEWAVGQIFNFARGKLSDHERRVVKDEWIRRFRQLPGYKTAEEMGELVAEQDWPALIELGYLDSAPNNSPNFSGFFTGEHSTTVEVGNDIGEIF